MEVKIEIGNGNIAKIFTMQDELLCLLELPEENGKIDNEYMARRIDQAFYENKTASDKLDLIQYVIRKCKHDGFTLRLHFENEEKRQNIGSLIREVRLQRGLKAKDVAMLVGIAAPNYSHIENEQTSPTYKTLVRIADVLDIKLDSLPVVQELVNIEERAKAAREKEWEAVEKNVVAQVRKEHPDMWWWAAKRVKETKYYKQLIRELENGKK